MKLECRRVDWPYVTPFRIAYYTHHVAETLRVTLTDGQFVGRGEAAGVPYRGETVDQLLDEVQRIKDQIDGGLTRDKVQMILPPGGARNAVDCALWDLEAKRSGRRVWEIAAVGQRALATSYTLSFDTPDAMARAAAQAARFPFLKLKLGGDGDAERVRAVRAVRADARIIVDANQAWRAEHLNAYLPALIDAQVELIEQPLAVGADDMLLDFDSPIPLCADESCQTSEDLPGLLGKYAYVNIKLDKTGGLTEALALARSATAAGFRTMVGCMGGSSLSAAPAFVVGQLCDLIDLDAPLLIEKDIEPRLHYDASMRLHAPDSHLWG